MGSSPRMRGARLCYGVVLLSDGIIPADAGSTTQNRSPNNYGRDHPRGCGEHKIYSVDKYSEWGSSPRMRGARELFEHVENRIGIIPADAGSTPVMTPTPVTRQDHPRGCGEHSVDLRSALSKIGSSPRMRGAHFHCLFEPIRQRIIPADAGSTRKVRKNGLCRKDHPRGCGEHVPESRQAAAHGGSSPRMRGARGHQRRPPVRGGIIPADAGST